MIEVLPVGNYLPDSERKRRIAARNAWLVENAKNYTSAELAERCFVSESRIRGICAQLGIKRKPTIQRKRVSAKKPATDCAELMRKVGWL